MLQRMSDQGLTDSGDQDYYLDMADLRMLPLWFSFYPDLFYQAKQSAATDANGVLLVPTTFMDILRIEDGSKNRYHPIKLQERNYRTGYYRSGYDITEKKVQLQVMEVGSEAVASKTFYFWTAERVTMGALTTDEPIYPLEFRDMLALKAAQLYFEDQGASFDGVARERERRFLMRLGDAKDVYEQSEDAPAEFAPSVGMDAHNPETLQRREGYLS